MNKQEKLIKNIINELYENNYELESEILDYTLKCYPEMIIEESFENIKQDEKVNNALDILNYQCKRNDRLMIKLNSLLNENDRDIRVNKIEEELREIQTKKIISVKEFTKIYSYSSDWQKNRRSRIRDRLPFIRVTDGGKITYNVKDVEIWFENNNIQF